MGISNRTAEARQSVFVVGTDGAIGHRLVTALDQEGYSVLGSTRRQGYAEENRVFIDLAADGSLQTLPSVKISTTILCAAITSMLHCQQDPVGTREVNVKNTVALARRLVGRGAHVIFLSSNTVFDGEVGFAKATDPTNPQTEYGKQKADAEMELLRLGGQVTVVRFSKIVAPDMPLLRGWVRDLSAGRTIHPFSDGVMAPMSVAFAVEVIKRVIDKQLSGIVQASASLDISYEQAAKYLAAKLGVEGALIEPISHVQMGISGFPRNTTLDTSGLKELGLDAPQATWALDQMMLGDQEV